MKPGPGFQLHPLAALDITDIWEFIAGDSPVAAGKMREEILDAVRTLVSLPYQGHRRPDITSQPLRFLAVRDYLIAYAPDTHPLSIIAILHGRRSPRIMAAILRGRQ